MTTALLRSTGRLYFFEEAADSSFNDGTTSTQTARDIPYQKGSRLVEGCTKPAEVGHVTVTQSRSIK
jgi:hypothetical protein